MNANAQLLDENYARWKDDPHSVDATWAAFFEGFELGCERAPEGVSAEKGRTAAEAELPLQTRVEGLVYAYRTLGHTLAQLDPLSEERPEQPLLSLRELGLQREGSGPRWSPRSSSRAGAP